MGKRRMKFTNKVKNVQHDPSEKPVGHSQTYVGLGDSKLRAT